MMKINENSRKIFFAIRLGQKLGSDWNIQSRISMRHDFESFRVGFWEVLVSGLWQNHGTSTGGGRPVPSPLPAVVTSSSAPIVTSSSGHRG